MSHTHTHTGFSRRESLLVGWKRVGGLVWTPFYIEKLFSLVPLGGFFSRYLGR